MNIMDFFAKWNGESQAVFVRSQSEWEALGCLHDWSSKLYDFSKIIEDKEERDILETVSVHLESANLVLSLGLYRQAFSSLRLGLEMGLSAIHFSIDKMNFREWQMGDADIKWHRLIDENDGVFSRRFARAFFPSVENVMHDFRGEAIFVYRKLSEYVHGNIETWGEEGMRPYFSLDLFGDYKKYYVIILKIILFLSICRYGRIMNESSKEDLVFLSSDFNNIQAIREFFGQS